MRRRRESNGWGATGFGDRSRSRSMPTARWCLIRLSDRSVLRFSGMDAETEVLGTDPVNQIQKRGGLTYNAFTWRQMRIVL